MRTRVPAASFSRAVSVGKVGKRAGTWSESVYMVVKIIPKGRVATYGQIAALLGRPRGGREVGWALHGCRDASVPCHRVVDRNGRLAPYFIAQRARLRKEQVTLKASRVDLEKWAWRPPKSARFAIDRVIESR